MEPLTNPDAASVAEWLDRWHLSVDGAVFQTATSTLAPAHTATGQPVMLKVSHHEEEQRGAALLAAWSGRGAARVLEHDGDAVLLERATGPRWLAEMSVSGWMPTPRRCSARPPAHCTRHPVPCSRRQARPSSCRSARRSGALRGCPTSWRQLHRQGAELAGALLDDERDVVALHGDLHHGNVLDFGERGWLAVDPKGLLGERAFEYASLCCNPTPTIALAPGRLESRLALVTDAAGLDSRRFTQWLVAWSALSSTWHARSGDPLAAASVASIGEHAAELL